MFLINVAKPRFLCFLVLAVIFFRQDAMVKGEDENGDEKEDAAAEEKARAAVRSSCEKVKADKKKELKFYKDNLSGEEPYCFFELGHMFGSVNNCKRTGLLRDNQCKSRVDTARDECKRYKATLPILRTVEHADFLKSRITKGPVWHAVVDAKRIGKELKWIDGSTIRYGLAGDKVEKKPRTGVIEKFSYLTLEENGHMRSHLIWTQSEEDEEHKEGVLALCMLQYPMPIEESGATDIRPLMMMMIATVAFSVLYRQ